MKADPDPSQSGSNDVILLDLCFNFDCQQTGGGGGGARPKSVVLQEGVYIFCLVFWKKLREKRGIENAW